MQKLPKDRKRQYFLLMEDGILGPVSLTTPFDESEIFYIESPHDTKIDRVGKAIASQAVVIGSRESAMDNSGYSDSIFILEKNVPGTFKKITNEERAAIVGNLFKNEQHVRWSVDSAHLIDESTLVIEVSDFIRTPVQSLTDIVFGVKTDTPLDKIATEQSVMVEKPVPDANRFNVVLSEGLMKKHKYNGLKAFEVIGLLKSVGVDEADATSMIGFLNAGERTIERQMPFDLSTIDGAYKETKAMDIVKNFAGQMFGKPVQQELLKEIVATQVADLLTEAPAGVFGAAQTLTSFASDAEALADRFEKLAIDHESEDFQTLAKCCVVTARLDRMMAKVATDVTSFDAREVFTSVKAARPAIEKMANLLYDLDNEQKMGAALVGDNTINQTYRVLQRLYVYGK